LKLTKYFVKMALMPRTVAPASVFSFHRRRAECATDVRRRLDQTEQLDAQRGKVEALVIDNAQKPD
jgi:hypothetical protein